mmetsp:Transcript_1268/g.4278  ORF Transcript_1268/g.4278 Transcript_1268/m.4278 type:complete len:250 (-) Transcript_1268:570-1319(-)
MELLGVEHEDRHVPRHGEQARLQERHDDARIIKPEQRTLDPEGRLTARLVVVVGVGVVFRFLLLLLLRRGRALAAAAAVSSRAAARLTVVGRRGVVFFIIVEHAAGGVEHLRVEDEPIDPLDFQEDDDDEDGDADGEPDEDVSDFRFRREGRDELVDDEAEDAEDPDGVADFREFQADVLHARFQVRRQLEVVGEVLGSQEVAPNLVEGHVFQAPLVLEPRHRMAPDAAEPEGSEEEMTVEGTQLEPPS